MEQQQQKITYKELFGFGADLSKAEELFARQRIAGYARALRARFVDRVRIFCPESEFGYMRDEMVERGADRHCIVHQPTLNTTYYNGIEMRKTLAELDLKNHEVCMSSNVYHGRAQFFGNALHDLGLVFVPAEAFILASVSSYERHEMVKQLREDYGDGPLTRLTIDDVRGIAERLIGKYKIPPQPRF